MDTVTGLPAAGKPDDDTLSACRKRSFLKLPVEIDSARLLAEFNSIPPEAWGASFWDNHCSIDMITLRGGTSGSTADYVTPEVANSPVLETLPYIASLLAPEGPFGGVTYGVIFRMKPNGITRAHYDDDDAWAAHVRIHVPIITNPGAVLMSDGRAKHIPVGEAWAFDNQRFHSVMNGDAERIHLIIDILPNPKLADLMRRSTFDPGEEDPQRWAATESRASTHPFAQCEPLSRKERVQHGFLADGFAGRITFVSLRARLFGDTGLKVGDIVFAADGVRESHVARTAIDHVAQTAKPGDRVMLDVLRGTECIKAPTRLVAPGHYSIGRKLREVFSALSRGHKPAASIR